MSPSGTDPTKQSPGAGGPASASSAQSRLGTWVRGKYLLDAVLGEGGMAVVYAATHRNKKRFAVKMLRPELSLAQDIRARFLREGHVANTVEHPGAVSVLDDDVAEDGCAFLVMELLDGESVDTLAGFAGGRLPAGFVLAVAHGLLDVLAAAHAKNIVHRDLKPGNLFVTRSGQLKVLDFGIARLRDATLSENVTRTGMALGTPAFMAPEQARGKTSLIDARTDLWAVGATVFTLLSGQNVHRGESTQEVMFETGAHPARSLATVWPEAPAALVALVDRALAFDPKDRWQDAAAMRDAVVQAYGSVFGQPIASERMGDLVASQARVTVRHRTPAVAALEIAPTLEAPSVDQTVPLDARAGNTTAQPVSASQPRPSRSAAPRRAAWGLGIAGIAALAVAAGVGVLARHAPPAAPSSQATAGEPTAATTATTPAAPFTGATAAMTAPSEPPEASVAPAFVSAGASARPAAPRVPASTPQPTRKPPAAPKSSASGPVTPPKIDESGL